MKGKFVTITITETHVLKLEVEVPEDISAEMVFDRIDNLTLKFAQFHKNSESSLDFDCEENLELDTETYQGISYKEFVDTYFFED